MEIVCGWCKKPLGFKPPYEDTSVTHGICDECLAKYFPHHAEKIEEILGDEKKRTRGNPMITDVDTALKDIADFYIQNRREITDPELESILMKHCGTEAEVKKFVGFLETELGQLRFKTLLKERERLPEFEIRLQAELTKEFRKEGFLPGFESESENPSYLKEPRGFKLADAYVCPYCKRGMARGEWVTRWSYSRGPKEIRGHAVHIGCYKELDKKYPEENPEAVPEVMELEDVGREWDKLTRQQRQPIVERANLPSSFAIRDWAELPLPKKDAIRMNFREVPEVNPPSYLKEMIAPREIVKAVGHWKPAGRIYGEVVSLQKQGIQYREALEIAMRNPKNWEGFEYLK